MYFFKRISSYGKRNGNKKKKETKKIYTGIESDKIQRISE